MVESENGITTNTAGKIKETPWVDAWVRWERNSMEVYDSDDGASADDEELPPPTENYTFNYPNPAASEQNNARDIKLVLSGYNDDSEQTWNSTGLTLWRSSHHLCQHLVSEEATMLQDTSIEHLRILEVGSGLGRCGLLAHHLSHANATTILTDGDTDTLKQLRQNVKNNTTDESNNISCRQLLWGEEHAKTFLSQQPEGRKFDMILGSDLIYVPSVIKPLFETVRVLLSTAEGKFLMAHCSRREGNEVDLQMVLDVADEEGFGHDALIQDDDISVFCFRHKQSEYAQG
ncbi:hypothetical protein ACHAXR_004957 [Thalassiosira sp. AJA248-18]